MNTESIRAAFPILKETINGYPLVYLDNGATTQKPARVIDAITSYYTHTNANVHRGVHTLSQRATIQLEAARKTVAQFFNAPSAGQIIFTAGTTDSINSVALGLAEKHLQEGDEIVLSVAEHHSNILPWQHWAQRHKGKLVVLPLNKEQSVDVTALEDKITPRTKLIALTHVSNTLGTITDVEAAVRIAKLHAIPILIDGAQSAPHLTVNLGKLQPDFFVCSAHKMYGPTGTGILYLSERWLNELPAPRTGGGTIKTVTFDHTEYAEGALRFEPGTPHVAGIIGFSEALKFMSDIGLEAIAQHEQSLLIHAQNQLRALPEIDLYGDHEHKAGVISFNVKGAHPFDVGTLLDKYGIAVRTGHHCTQPLMQHYGIQGTVRASFGVYNTIEETNFFIEKLKKVIKMLS